jgi:alanine-glyoxylate transaminase/(R)-3-amino-2-methylpropionate-pyruvate transaminase
VPKPYDGPSKQEVWLNRKTHLSPAMPHFYKKPVMITDGHMQWLYDEKGRRYLDVFGGIVTVSVGHSHPAINKAAQEQLARLQHTTCIYLNDQISMYAKELADRMPGNLKVCYFVNSGSEANDMALLMSRLYTGNSDVMALRNGYHGMSNATMGMTAMHTWKYPVAQGQSVHHAMNPDPYRGAFGNDADAYVRDMRDIINASTSGNMAAFFHESIQGVGGSIEYADGFIPKAYELIREHGGLCIADEVQTGFGRTGTNYWGFQNHGVIPDIVTMAKGIGNGFPLAAVVTTPEIAQTLSQRLHFNTYGGNPIVSAVGRAVLRTIDDENLQENCAVVGGHLKQRLLQLKDKHDIIGDVRGRGLMLGVELVTDRTTKEPATAETAHVFERLRDLGVLIGKGGIHGNMFRTKPPMCFTKEDADFVADAMDHALAEL